MGTRGGSPEICTQYTCIRCTCSFVAESANPTPPFPFTLNKLFGRIFANLREDPCGRGWVSTRDCATEFCPTLVTGSGAGLGLFSAQSLSATDLSPICLRYDRSKLIYATADEAVAYMFYRCFFSVFFWFFLCFFPSAKNMRRPFSGTAERIFMKLLPNDTGENGVCNVVPPPGEC